MQNPLATEYHVAFDGNHPGTGTADDPLMIENHSGYELPTSEPLGTSWMFRTNGFIEGCNNKTKVLKRTCFGTPNFRNFRNRILHCDA